MLFSRSSSWRRATIAGLGLYALFAFATAFEHHDLSCELKTPQHCIACASSVVGSDPQPTPMLGAAQLADAGSALTRDFLYDGAVLSFRSTGRSPPVASA